MFAGQPRQRVRTPPGEAEPHLREPLRPVDVAEWQREQLAGIEGAFAAPGLLGRQHFIDILGATIREATASGHAAALVLLDLNNFSGVNAAWGPAAGDAVIDAASRRIADFLAEFDATSDEARPKAGRLDSDHFAIVVPQVESFGNLRNAVVDLIRVLAQPLTFSGHSMALSARAAIIQIPVHGRSVTSALGRGFRLVNTVARAKVDGVALSDAEVVQGSALVMLEHDLATAIARDQLYIVLQPKVQITTGKVRSAEALARWHHPDHGAIPPPIFIETAEKSGLIFDLGLRILRDACRAGSALSGKVGKFSVAVNVSPHQLAHPEFLSRFLEVIDREGVAPGALQIEVTETAAMMGGERVVDSLRSLCRCGISVAIDDFGTGFSNLASLSALPADTLKIDRSLVEGVDRGGKAEALLGIAVQLGRTFGLATVAEGVETDRQYRHLSEIGCDQVQGFLTGRPVHATEFAKSYLGA